MASLDGHQCRNIRGRGSTAKSAHLPRLGRPDREHHAPATPELREHVEYSLQHVFRAQQAHAKLRFLAGHNFRARLDPVALQVSPRVAGRNPNLWVTADALGLARLHLAVDVERLRSPAGRIAREPYRSADTLAALAEGFHVHILVPL